MLYEMSVPTALEKQLYVNATVGISRVVCKNELNNIQNMVNSTVAGVAVQLVSAAGNVFMNS